MDKQFRLTLYNGCNYLFVFMLGLKLIHVSKRDLSEVIVEDESIGIKQEHNMIEDEYRLYNSCDAKQASGLWRGSWWRHQMETFSALLAICAGNSPVPGEFPAQRPVTRSFDVFFDLRPNKRLSKQWRGWWFETPSCSLWRQCNVNNCIHIR